MRSRIITFYSYKGGTGRSMGLANTAWILASNGMRVLVVDWDLEAPGLHRYFHPFLPDHELRSSPGVMDLVWEFATAAMDPATPDEPGWHERLARIQPYAMSVEHEFPGPGTIDFVPAGRQDALYSTLVTSFDWSNFYERLGGGGFIEALKRSMRERYDYVLIDSRTGLSDTAGICTVQLPDILVNCFALSTQAIDGAEAVAASVHRQRADDQLRMFPVPMRVEDAERARLESSRDYARSKFGRYLSHLPDPEGYWGEVEVPYKPFYAYEEILATIGDRPRQQDTVLAATERIVAHLTDQEITRCVTELKETERRDLLDRFRRAGSQEPAPRTSSDGRHAVRVFISYAHDSVDHFQAVRELWYLLRGQGIDARLDRPPGQRTPEWPRWQRQQLLDAEVVLLVPSPAYRRLPVEETVQLRDVHGAHPDRFMGVVLPGGSREDLVDVLHEGEATRWTTVTALTPEDVRPLAELISRRAPVVRSTEGDPLDSPWPWSRVHDDPELAEAADALSHALYRLQLREPGLRRLHEPFRFDIRWSLNRRFLTPAEAGRLPVGSGTLRDVEDLFTSLPHGRLVILGAAGSGKSSVLALLALELLRRRADVPGLPVPVSLSLTSWDPAAQTLTDWITDRLRICYPMAPQTARHLVTANMVLPMLDGLDELSPSARAHAVESLQRDIPPDGRYVLTSRTAEYEEVIQRAGRTLARAAVIELRPLQPADAMAYLSYNRLPGDLRWGPVLNVLAGRPEAPLAQLLTQPLMLRLAEEVYRSPSTDPAELLRFHSESDIQKHLLDALIPATYVADPVFGRGRRSAYSPDAARRWLGFLARHLEQRQTREFAWWELHRTFSPWSMRLRLGCFAVLLTAPVMALRLLAETGVSDLFPQLTLTLAGWSGVTVLLVTFTAVRSPEPRSGLTIRGRGALRLPRRLPTLTVPRASLRADWRATLTFPLLGGALAASAVAAGALTSVRPVLATAFLLLLTALLTLILTLRNSASGRYWVTVFWLALRGRLPWRLMRFLDDAHARGVLRQAGSFYQFRHARLQDVLADRDHQVH
ncbi:hypothetical protein ADK57_28580 [Streptomyces sp. MMG1533]|uniref:KGGVGR-motif variant AAA ATPase n=1 Tax=Streptomyces sp. MMG1533 TaxID=1415546 RepID=UPI0006AF1382|nr:NACHT domain-containing protein [Streptomyces sp. MMG1533]KOU61090.1 hypothetical protein ADK57_28580 [Streptomyces sp. MMG1533]